MIQPTHARCIFIHAARLLRKCCARLMHCTMSTGVERAGAAPAAATGPTGKAGGSNRGGGKRGAAGPAGKRVPGPPRSTRSVELRAEATRVKRQQAEAQRAKQTRDFVLDTTHTDVQEYSSLYDEHLASFFANPKTRKLLYKKGLIDRDGNVIDVEKYKSRLFIVEQEFKNLEELERTRMREEEERKRMISIKRQEMAEKEAMAAKLAAIKEQRRARQEALRESLEARVSYNKVRSGKTKGKVRRGQAAAASKGPEVQQLQQPVDSSAIPHGDEPRTPDAAAPAPSPC